MADSESLYGISCRIRDNLDKCTVLKDVLNSSIYVDKTEVFDYINSVINTTSKFICNIRPRWFRKSITADMMTAYYSKGCRKKRRLHHRHILK